MGNFHFAWTNFISMIYVFEWSVWILNICALAKHLQQWEMLMQVHYRIGNSHTGNNHNFFPLFRSYCTFCTFFLSKYTSKCWTLKMFHGSSEIYMGIFKYLWTHPLPKCPELPWNLPECHSKLEFGDLGRTSFLVHLKELYNFCS